MALGSRLHTGELRGEYPSDAWYRDLSISRRRKTSTIELLRCSESCWSCCCNGSMEQSRGTQTIDTSKSDTDMRLWGCLKMGRDTNFFIIWWENEDQPVARGVPNFQTNPSTKFVTHRGEAYRQVAKTPSASLLGASLNNNNNNSNSNSNNNNTFKHEWQRLWVYFHSYSLWWNMMTAVIGSALS